MVPAARESEEVLVALIGAPGCGSTTVGRTLAQRLGCRFVDTDELVQTRAGKSKQEIYIDDGTAGFHAYEVPVVREALGGDGVVAVSSGAILDPELRRLLRAVPVVWLHVELPVAARRIGLVGGGLIADARAMLVTQLRERTPLYAEVADIGVRTSQRTVEEVVDVLVAWLSEREA